LEQNDQGMLPATPSVEELQTVLEQVEAQQLAAKPAVLQVRFTAKPGQSQGEADGFLDLTLVSAKVPVEARRVEVTRQRFAGLLKALYRQLSRHEALAVDNPSSPSRQLHALLVQPLQQSLETQGIQTLLIAADQGLQAVPFAALSDGQAFFGDRYAFGLTPSLALTPLAPVPVRPQGQLALGASKFEGLAPLPLVPQELERIDAATGADLYLNSDFSSKTLLDGAADQRYSRVHVATHADFRPGGPARSVLHTGTGPMSMAQFAELRRERADVPLDLVVLSACRTLLGDKDSELGFAGLALQAGARSAIGTLWYVDDVVTSAFFVQFYRLLDQGVPKAEALLRTRQLFSSGGIRLVDDQVLGASGAPLLNELSPAQRQRIMAGVQNPFFWTGIELVGSPW
jgi:CHAT domain-containing protein